MEDFKTNEYTSHSKGHSLIDCPEDYTVFDIETTGLDPKYDEIIEIAAVKVRNNDIIDTFSALVKPNNEVSLFITNLTGITNDMLVSAEKIEVVLRQFLDFVKNDIVVGHNINFDINFINNASIRYFSKNFPNDFVDTLRLSRKYVKDTENYKLQTLIKHFNIEADTAHRALEDCYSAQKLYEKLRVISIEYEKRLTNSISIIDVNNEYNNKHVYISGTFKTLSETALHDLIDRIGAIRLDAFYADKTDYFIMSYYSYRNYLDENYSERMVKANRLKDEGKLKILSEYEFLCSLGIKCSTAGKTHKRKYENSSIKISELVASVEDFDTEHPFYEKLCVFTGTLEKMSRRKAMQKVLDCGGSVGNSITSKTNYLILGNNDYCAAIKDGKSNKQKKAEEFILRGSDLQIISENVFYNMITEE